MANSKSSQVKSAGRRAREKIMAVDVISIPHATDMQAKYLRTAIREQADTDTRLRSDRARYAALCRYGKAGEKRGYWVSWKRGGVVHNDGKTYSRRRDAERAVWRYRNTEPGAYVERIRTFL